MALKAQNQCRMTLETLATIKNSARGVRKADEHQQRRAAAGEQRRGAGPRAGPHARGECADRADRTIGAATWRMVGHRSGGQGRRRRSTWRLWEKSNGPRSDEGKARTSRNGFKGGHWPALRELARTLNEALREQREALRRR
ncbi:MAG: hypothetical protein U1E72_03575 [Burkholderiaceae bacterium]